MFAAFAVFDRLVFDNRLGGVQLKYLDPGDRRNYIGRFTPRGETIHINLTVPNVVEVLLHECCHASLWLAGDSAWGDHGASFGAELARAELVLDAAAAIAAEERRERFVESLRAQRAGI